MLVVRENSPFTRITATPILDTTFTDIGLTNWQKYTYRLTSEGQGNLESPAASDPVSSVPVQTDVGRVILVAGGEDRAQDRFWPTSNYLGNLAYRMFQHRRLGKEKIFYLNDRVDQDVDRDGFVEEVDAGVRGSSWEEAWRWAEERVHADHPL